MDERRTLQSNNAGPASRLMQGLIVLQLKAGLRGPAGAAPSNWDFRFNEYVPRVGALGTTIGLSVELHRLTVYPVIAAGTLGT